LIQCDDVIRNQRQVHGKFYKVRKSVDNCTLGKHRFTELEKNLPRHIFGLRPTWKIFEQFYIGQA